MDFFWPRWMMWKKPRCGRYESGDFEVEIDGRRNFKKKEFKDEKDFKDEKKIQQNLLMVEEGN